MAYILYSSSKYIYGRAVLVAGLPSAIDAGFKASRSPGGVGFPKHPDRAVADSMVDLFSAGVTQPVTSNVADTEKCLVEALQAGSTARQVYAWSASAVSAWMLVLNRYEVSGC